MLALLFIAQSSLREISERVAARFPASAPVVKPLRSAFPDSVGELKRKSQGFYNAQILSAVLGKKTPAYVACGAEEAAVARYGDEHVQIVRAKTDTGANCMFDVDQQNDVETACDDGIVVQQRKGVSTVLRARDYIRVRGHQDVLGGGEQAFALACALSVQ